MYTILNTTKLCKCTNPVEYGLEKTLGKGNLYLLINICYLQIMM